MTIYWKTGVIVNSCGHLMHLSCYQQHLKSRNVRFLRLKKMI